MKKLFQQIKEHPLEALSAIAAMAAVVAAFAAQQSAEQLSNAALRPHLDITQRLEPYFGLRIDNAGQGAAIIEEFEIYVDSQPVSDIISGNPYRSALVDSGLAVLDDKGNDLGGATITTIDQGVAIKAGAEIFIFKWKGKLAATNEMVDNISKIDIRIVYSSLSNETYCVLYKGGEFANYQRDNRNDCKP